MTSLSSPITRVSLVQALAFLDGDASGVRARPAGVNSTSDLRDWMARVGVFPQDFGTIGAGDDSGAINGAIAKLASVGGGTLWIPPAPFSGGVAPPGSYVSTHPWVMQSGVHINGLSRQIIASWPGATGDCIVADGSMTGQKANMRVSNLYVLCSGARTAGIALKVHNVAEMLVDNMIFDGCYTGSYLRQTNTVYLDTINFNNITGPWGVYAYADPTVMGTPGNYYPKERSDITNLREVTINNFLNGGDCIIVDGFVSGFHGEKVYALAGRIGLHVMNSAQNTLGSSLGFYPQYLKMDRLETDRALYESVRIEGGKYMEFIDATLSNTSGASNTQQDGTIVTVTADANCVEILPDTGFSNTSDIQFLGGVVGNCRGIGMVIQAKTVQVLGTKVGDVSKSGTNNNDCIAIGANSDEIMLRDVIADHVTTRARYSLSVAAGVTRSSARGCSWKGNNTGDVGNLSSSTASNSFTGNLGSNGVWN